MEDMDDGVDDFYSLSVHSAAPKAVATTPNQDQLTSVAQNSVSQALPGSLRTNGMSNDEQHKTDNQKRAADLRAKLIAQRQNTPATNGRPLTPFQNVTKRADTQTKEDQPSSDVLGLESLLAEGRAAAETKIEQTASLHPDSGTATGDKYQASSTTTGLPSGQNMETQLAITEQFLSVSERPTHTPQTTDDYYTDLSIWLEITGYHDFEHRNSRLATYKERKALEHEAARLAERLEELRQAERSYLTASGSVIVHSAPAHIPPPPALPRIVPVERTIQQAAAGKLSTPTPTTSGAKRAYSPVPAPLEKSARRRQDSIGSHTALVHQTHETIASAARRCRSPSPNELRRNMSHSENERPLWEGFNYSRSGRNEARDLSLERREKYYNFKGQSSAASPDLYRYNEPATASPRAGRTRTSYDNAHGRPTAVNPRGNYHHYRGNTALDLRKGGVRFFMIKSWNLDNVNTAMREGVWATQQKNEKEFTKAYQTSKHVVLLFSANQSKSFQGYAVMASAPDPSLSKPTFCAKLNWDTSAAFRLQWMATTSVHFSKVGHIDNTLNLDEYDQPQAVLVGRDGQEISPAAGVAVCEIMDDFEETQKRKQAHQFGSV